VAVAAVALLLPATLRSRSASAEPTAWETMRPIVPALGSIANRVAPLERETMATEATVEETGAGTITVRVISRPAGAEVVRASDGVRLGVTPVDLEMPRGAEAARLKVRRPGFVPESIELPRDRDGQVAVVLTPRARLQAANAQAKRPKLQKPIKDGALDPYAN
jgi:hypothetical protein